MRLPLLVWVSKDIDNEFNELKRGFDELRRKEKKFLAVRDSDYKDYPDFRNQPDKGVFRLFPKEIYDGKLVTQGGGSYFSFVSQVHDYQAAPDIGLERGSLRSGFSGCNFGYMTDLGDVSLRELDESTSALRFLLNFEVARGEPNIRKQQMASWGFESGGTKYRGTLDDVRVGQTFALRSILFDRHDILVAFKIIGTEKDGSLIIAWKKIKSFPESSCR